MMKRFSNALVLLSGLLLAAGCQSKGPVPGGETPSKGPAPQVGTTETTGAHPGAANPHAGMGDPHAGMGIDTPAPSPDVELDASRMLDIGAIAFKVPDAWQAQTPRSSMRRAQLVAQGDKGPAELIVFFFGPQGAGSAQDNIDRWVGQFTTPEGAPVTNPKIQSLEVSGQDVTRIEVAGRYASGMGGPGQAQAPSAGQRLIAAIVQTAGGPYYFKFLGPDATVTEQQAAFDALLASIVAAP